MADQTEPQESRRVVDQSLNADNQAGQGLPVGQSQQFAAPAESFGSFGPLPNYPTQASIPYNGPQFAPAPLTPANAQAPTLNNPYAPAPLAANAYYPTGTIAGNPYVPG